MERLKYIFSEARRTLLTFTLLNLIQQLTTSNALGLWGFVQRACSCGHPAWLSNHTFQSIILGINHLPVFVLLLLSLIF